MSSGLSLLSKASLLDVLITTGIPNIHPIALHPQEKETAIFLWRKSVKEFSLLFV
jgi:hypothetical protein